MVGGRGGGSEIQWHLVDVASVAFSSRRDFSSKMESGVVYVETLQYYREACLQAKSMVRVWCVVLQCVSRNQPQPDKNGH